MFPLIKRRAPLVEMLRGQRVAVSPEAELTTAQRRLAEEFKSGIAEALGVPPEAVKQELVEKWVKRWAGAWVKEEFQMMRLLGYEIAKAISR